MHRLAALLYTIYRTQQTVLELTTVFKAFTIKALLELTITLKAFTIKALLELTITLKAFTITLKALLEFTTPVLERQDLRDARALKRVKTGVCDF